MMKVILLLMFLTPLNLNFSMVSFYSVLCFLSVLIMVMSYKFGSNKVGYYGFDWFMLDKMSYSLVMLTLWTFSINMFEFWE